MIGTNLGLEYEYRGYSPKMGLGDAKQQADREGAICPWCNKEPESMLHKVLILRYGLCLNCLIEEE